MESAVRPPATGKLIAGVTILLVGVLFTLDNLGVVEARHFWTLWPVALVAIGLSQVLNPSPSGKATGWIVLAIGLLLLVRNLGWLPFRISQLWPLILVAVGVRIVLGASGRRLSGERTAESAAATLNEWVAFGGIDRKVTSGEFVGGDLAAFCGGWDVDLRRATPVPEGARIDVFAWWGGGEIRVPPDWEVTMSLLPLFAGYEDKTVRPETPLEGAPKRLLVTGTIVMGGVTVKN
ncbi:hypothetical protein FBQ97_00830 [Acidobacteria bacterium ACD]|nr:MAG: hypothetical protein EDX89_14610 [Acidobacteriota bacterium]MCE7960130.1 hypothetical protein [Acidobacteria bacterium ACB2]MDL1948347.1 hypothetical protein [Acidobacteria bacterium ACD]